MIGCMCASLAFGGCRGVGISAGTRATNWTPTAGDMGVCTLGVGGLWNSTWTSLKLVRQAQLGVAATGKIVAVGLGVALR